MVRPRQAGVPSLRRGVRVVPGCHGTAVGGGTAAGRGRPGRGQIAVWRTVSRAGWKGNLPRCKGFLPQRMDPGQAHLPGPLASKVQRRLRSASMGLTEREREIVALLRTDPLLDAAALAERLGSTRAAVSVHLSKPHPQGRPPRPRLPPPPRGLLRPRRRRRRPRRQGPHPRPGRPRHEQPRHLHRHRRWGRPQHRREPRPPR